MTNYAVGHLAEQHAATYLAAHGFTVVKVNWRTPRCEIDLVALRDQTIYLFEVKYRKTNAQGTGLDYVTQKKQRQMAYAAESWVLSQGWAGPYCLGAIEVSGLGGNQFEVTELVTEI